MGRVSWSDRKIYKAIVGGGAPSAPRHRAHSEGGVGRRWFSERSASSYRGAGAHAECQRKAASKQRFSVPAMGQPGARDRGCQTKVCVVGARMARLEKHC